MDKNLSNVAVSVLDRAQVLDQLDSFYLNRMKSSSSSSSGGGRRRRRQTTLPDHGTCTISATGTDVLLTNKLRIVVKNQTKVLRMFYSVWSSELAYRSWWQAVSAIQAFFFGLTFGWCLLVRKRFYCLSIKNIYIYNLNMVIFRVTRLRRNK